jgi:hypothetical protein
MPLSRASDLIRGRLHDTLVLVLSAPVLGTAGGSDSSD